MRLPFLWTAQNLIKPDIQNLLGRCPKNWGMEAKSEEARRIGSKTAHFLLFLFIAKSGQQTAKSGSKYFLGSKKLE